MHKNKKYNIYDLSGEYGIGYTLKNEEFYFDLEDYEKIKDYCWYIETGGRVCARNNKNKTPLKLHKIIMGITDSKTEIDHIHHNQRDNRKSELRICLHQQNLRNSKIQKNNSTGYKGVSYRKDTKKYTSYIMVNNKKINLGCFTDIENSLIERLKAEKKFFGEFSSQQNLFEKYNI